jgi:hypothetical protein
MKKSILAIEAAAPAIPPKPRTAAIMAMMKKTTAQYSMMISFSARQYGMDPMELSGIFPFPDCQFVFHFRDTLQIFQDLLDILSLLLGQDGSRYGNLPRPG